MWDYILSNSVKSKTHESIQEDKEMNGGRWGTKIISLSQELDKEMFKSWWKENKNHDYDAYRGWH